ncbi:VWA domain-containing protein [bacterium]|nr:VWA domain-containing protein [bacterium]
MTWLYGSWAWILWAIPVLIAALGWAFRKSERRWDRVAIGTIRHRIVNGFDAIVARRRTGLSVVALILLAVAALRPQFGTEYVSAINKGQSIVVAVDTSLSMDATDLSPSRIEFAKEDLNALMTQLKGDRISLVTFAGTAAIQCPFTIDYLAAKLFIDDIMTGDLPIPGTNLASPIHAAIAAYRDIPGRKTLIIYSDGESFEGDYRAAAADAKSQGIVIHTVGIGTEKGDVIPLYDENRQPAGFKVDRSNKTVVSKRDNQSLKEVAAITGGRYIQVSAHQAAAPQLAVLLGKAGEADYRAYLMPRHHDRYTVLAALALIALVLEWIMSPMLPLWRPKL